MSRKKLDELKAEMKIVFPKRCRCDDMVATYYFNTLYGLDGNVRGKLVGCAVCRKRWIESRMVEGPPAPSWIKIITTSRAADPYNGVHLERYKPEAKTDAGAAGTASDD